MKIKKNKENREIRNLLVIGILVWVMYTILNTVVLVSMNYQFEGITSAVVQGTASVSIAAGTASIIIDSPQNNTQFNTQDNFNVTASITPVNGNIVNCNATIIISNPSAFNLTSTATQDVGNLTNGNSQFVSWNITAINQGSSDITTFTNCTLGNSDSDTIQLAVLGVTFNFTLIFEWGVTHGRPVNVNVTTFDSNNNQVANATIRITEKNGWSAFAESQVDDNGIGLVVFSTAILRTDLNGTANFTLMPTGGYEAIEPDVGPYNLSAEMLVNGAVVAAQSINWTQRSIPDPNGTTNKVYHQSYVEFARDKYLRLYRVIAAWLDVTAEIDGGQNFNFTIFTNGTDSGFIFNVTSGKPIGLRLTVKNHTTGLGITDATVRIIEENGWSMWAIPQEWDDHFGGTGLSAIEIGEIKTNSEGKINFTFVATGGQPSYETNLGAYNTTLDVLVDDVIVYRRYINVTDRTIPDVPAGATAESIPNASFIRFVRDKILRLYRTLFDWLDYT